MKKTVGIIGEDKVSGSIQIAAPLGVLAGIVQQQTQLQQQCSRFWWLLKHVMRLSLPSTLTQNCSAHCCTNSL